MTEQRRDYFPKGAEDRYQDAADIVARIVARTPDITGAQLHASLVSHVERIKATR